MATTQELATDSGITLKKRVLSTPEVLAQSVANMAPSAAMALLPLFVFFSAGNALWLSFALGLVVMLMVGYCAAQFGKRIDFIHEEVYVNNQPKSGLRPQLKAFHLQTEPWLFTINRKGVIAARLEGAFGLNEFSQAVQAALR